MYHWGEKAWVRGYLIAKPTFTTVVVGWLENAWRDVSSLQLETKEWELQKKRIEVSQKRATEYIL